jgi:hypothetical protein
VNRTGACVYAEGTRKRPWNAERCRQGSEDGWTVYACWLSGCVFGGGGWLVTTGHVLYEMELTAIHWCVVLLPLFELPYMVCHSHPFLHHHLHCKLLGWCIGAEMGVNDNPYMAAQKGATAPHTGTHGYCVRVVSAMGNAHNKHS